MAELSDPQWRSKVETDIVLLKAGMTEVQTDIAAFRDEWRTKADEDRKAHRNARMTFPQLVATLAATVTMTAVLLGGLMYLINVSAASVRSDLTSQVASSKQSAEAANAQLGLTVRGMVDGQTALNTAIQQIQREQASDRVRLGLVEQQAVANTRFIEQAQGFDAMMARHGERLKALEQTVREIAARRQP